MTFLSILKRDNRNDLVDSIYNKKQITAVGVIAVLDILKNTDLSLDELFDLDWDELEGASYDLNLNKLQIANYKVIENKEDSYLTSGISSLIVFSRRTKQNLKNLIADLYNNGEFVSEDKEIIVISI
jgi:hypothetical protein